MFFTSHCFAYVWQKRSCDVRHFSEMPEMCEEGGVWTGTGFWIWTLLVLLSLFDGTASNQTFYIALHVSV